MSRGPLGLNQRNDHIVRVNPPEAIARVDDKLATKDALGAAGVPVAPTLGVLHGRGGLGRFLDHLPATACVKPARGMAGHGVLVLAGRDDDGWRTPSGRRVSRRRLRAHCRQVLDGEHSKTITDAVLAEPLLVCHPELDVSAGGLPDLRVVVDDGRPLMAMLRVPTEASDGRANLHAGGLGVAIDLASGHATRAVQDGRQLLRHPDTGVDLLDVAVPDWEEILGIAQVCGPAVGLGYVGVDVVVDRDLGPVVLEVNARPGLTIQQVTGRPQVLPG